MNKKYIDFDLVQILPKTSIWAVRNTTSKLIIGYIKWYPGWRQYCFFPNSETVFSLGCLHDINEFIITATMLKNEDKCKKGYGEHDYCVINSNTKKTTCCNCGKEKPNGSVR
jgi:hypothetical protein